MFKVLLGIYNFASALNFCSVQTKKPIYHKFSSWQQFATNPNFKIVLKDENKDGLCTFIVSLQTKLSGIEKKMDEVGFGIFKFKNNERLDEKFLKKSQNQVGNSGDSVEELPQVTKQFKLKPGKYIIIPFTKRANQEGDFLLRIFSEKPSYLQELFSEFHDCV